ncbi:MAG TPA: heparan-alpha-glucosaminide N-acetyltransferase domain-containing protein [Bacteroidota bacterium]|nr:heparan-alpha-glucosaminide N-acetyltransferase domain-containing protein [Bacteroidota bacterium]
MSKARLLFIDILRGIAALVMIEVHVFNSMIRPEIRQAAWFDVLNFINGLVAPSFLFVAGYVFVIASERKLPEFRQYGSSFWRQMGRIFTIWVIGYALHLPFFSYSRTISETTEAGWLKFFQADILHCIAAGLLLLFISRLVIRSDRLFNAWLLGCGILLVVSAPFLGRIDFTVSVHPALAAYLNGLHYSQFPIFPWLGFMTAGGYAATLFQRSRQSGTEKGYTRLIAAWGTGLLLVGWVAPLVTDSIPLFGDIRSDPFFFALRLGIVFLLVAGLRLYEGKGFYVPRFVLDASRESLLVYAAHLLVIYGDFWSGKSVANLYGKTFNVWECLLATLALMALMVYLAKGWGWLKQRSLQASRAVGLATGLIALVLFFIRES